MIYIYTGKIGDGKSYHVVKNELIPAVKAGRPVLTNLDIGPEHIRAIAFECGLSPAQVKITVVDGERLKEMLQLDENDKEGKHLPIEKQTLIIVDEAQKLWRAREYKETSNNFLFLLEWHRHLGLDVVFISQDVGQMDKAIGRLCNEFLTVKNLRMLHSFVGNRYILQHRQRPGDPVVATTRGTLDPKYFRFYRSMVNEGMRTHETTAGLSLVKVGAVVALLCVAGARVYSQGAFGGAVKTMRQTEAKAAALAASPGQTSPSMPVVEPLARRGETLRDAVRDTPRPCRIETQIGRSRLKFRGTEDVREWPRAVTVCD